MVQLDGVEYAVKTPEENTDDIVSYINEYCTNNGVKNTYGEDVFIEPNDANPLYVLIKGMGYSASILQKLAYSAGCALSVAASSDTQLLNIASIAGVPRTTATKTIITGVAFAKEDEECLITTSLIATVTIAGQEVTFQPAYDVRIETGGSAQIVLLAQQYGSFAISPNTITKFDTPVTGLRSIQTLASIPGQEEEPISKLRERIQRRSVMSTRLDRAAAAIQALPGVSACSIYFNYNPETPQSISVGPYEVSVPPRQAMLMVQGYNDDVAQTFYNYLICATTNTSAVPGVITQNYVTKAGQSIPVYMIPPHQQPVYIKAHFNNTITSIMEGAISDNICTLANSVGIGATITSVMVIDLLHDRFPDLEVQGAVLSLDGLTYDYLVEIPIASSPIFSNSRISVQGLV